MTVSETPAGPDDELLAIAEQNTADTADWWQSSEPSAPVPGSAGTTGPSEPSEGVQGMWPEWLSAEYTAMHTAIYNEIVKALEHCYASADADGSYWTREGWLSCSASNILGLLKRSGLPPFPAEKAERLSIEAVERESWDDDEDDPDQIAFESRLAVSDDDLAALERLKACEPGYDERNNLVVAWPEGHTDYAVSLLAYLKGAGVTP